MPSPTSAPIPRPSPLHWYAAARAIVGLGLALASIHPLAAQTPRADAKAQAAQAKAAQRAEQQRAKAQQRAQAKQNAIDQKQLRQNPPAALERFLQMNVKQRREALSGLPPARQKQLLQRIRNLELLSDDERQQLKGRFQSFADLPQPRQQAVRRELRTLRQLPPKDRAARLNSDEVRQNYSSEEQQLLHDVAGPPQ